MTEVDQAVTYPRYCFHLSPTANTWCLLYASDIHALKQHAGFQGEKFYFYQNLPIKWVRVVGPIVAIDDFSGRRVYTIDDSSGNCIEALVTMQQSAGVNDAPGTLPYQSETSAGDPAKSSLLHTLHSAGLYDDLDVGHVVDVKGALSTYRDEKQINIEKMTKVKSTAQEVSLWERRWRFRHEVLDKPWRLSDKDIRRCRKEAEAEAASSEKRAKRLKAVSEASTSTKQKTKICSTTSASEGSVKHEVVKKRSKVKIDYEARVKGLLRQGSVNGKYNALGL